MCVSSFQPILYNSLKSNSSILVVAVWYIMWNNIGNIEENRSSMDIMPRDWNADGDSSDSTSSNEVCFRLEILIALVWL